MLPRYRRTLVLLAVIVLLGACWGAEEAPPPGQGDDAGHDAGDDDPDVAEDVDVPPPGPAEIDVIPEYITFSGVEIGESESKTITIRNLGESPLHIFDASIIHFDHSGEEELKPGDDWPDEMMVEPLHFHDFELVYEPEVAGSIRGELVIFSSDQDRPESTVRIETISAYPELDAPDRISFGTVEPGESELHRVEIYNRGLSVLQISSVELSEDSDDPDSFHVDLVGASELPAALQRHNFFYLDVTFLPQHESTQRAHVVIETNDPERQEHHVYVSGNRPEPCIQTNGDVDFGLIADGATATQYLTLTNCSATADLQISDFELVDDAEGTFEVIGPVPTAFTIPPAQAEQIELRATLTTNQEVVGSLHFTTNDPVADEFDVQLRVGPAP